MSANQSSRPDSADPGAGAGRDAARPGAGAGRDAARPGAGHDAARRDASHGDRILSAWRRLSRRPGGRWLFSRLIGRFAPYTGSMGARVETLETGGATVTLRDRRRVRNHLRSVHAIALANLGELATGLAMTTAMPAGVRGIPTAIRIDYVKKARGTLTCAATVAAPDVTEPTSHEVVGHIRNEEGDVVATIRVTWALERVT